ncbi:MAG: methionyl-tRNA formyltransferase [candidate division Zixibacteria bacterium]|nr:methionyl-tRNA formyltransferase [candidate division Zixibacteria bacterium]
MRVTLVGTPSFAIPTFEALYQAQDVDVAQVITKTEKRAGRGLKPTQPEVFNWAQTKGLRVVQLDTLRRTPEAGLPSLDLTVDAVVVVASAFFIPKWFREPPPDGRVTFGAINLHPSLLPKLRGPAPINRAIIENYDPTGVTTLKLVDEMDAGDILLQQEVRLHARETAGSLAGRLAEVGAALMLTTLRGLGAGTVQPKPQDHAQATYAPKITTEMRGIDWYCPAERTDRLARGLYPDAPARASLQGDIVQILAAEPAEGEADAAPGTIIAVDEAGVVVACGEGALKLTRVKPAGRGEMTAHAFALGRRLAVGDRFDEGKRRDDS